MKRILTLVLLLLVFTSTMLSAVSLLDLNEENKQQVKEFSISVDQEITETNFEAVEGIKYNIVFKTPHYIIIEIDGYYYIIDTTE